MHLLSSLSRGSWQGFDFTPVLLVTVLAFVVVALLEFSRNLPGAERGLLLFERACPIHQTACCASRVNARDNESYRHSTSAAGSLILQPMISSHSKKITSPKYVTKRKPRLAFGHM
jgi:hypothetical protein